MSGTASVNSRVGQGKRVFDDADLGCSSVNDDFDNVEAERDVGHLQHAQPGHRAADEQAAFFPVNGVERAAEILGRAGFDLDKNQGVAGFVATNEVDFPAAGTSEVAVKNFVAASGEGASREMFAAAAECEVGSLSRKPA